MSVFETELIYFIAIAGFISGVALLIVWPFCAVAANFDKEFDDEL